jgi:hypothetical protein
MISSGSGKSVGSAIKTLIQAEYKFLGGERIQDMLVHDVMNIYEKYHHDPWTLSVGQIMWFAVAIDEKPGPAKTLSNTRIVPVILSVVHEEDQKLRENGYAPKEIRKTRIVRILKEAYNQGGVLSQGDVAIITGISAGVISKEIREYQTESGEVLPYRGTIHDLGRTLTHKRIIVALYLQNVPTPDIARRTSHTEEACDRYIKSFKRVQMLADKNMKPLEIARLLEMSESLVKEYLELHNEFIVQE